MTSKFLFWKTRWSHPLKLEDPTNKWEYLLQEELVRADKRYGAGCIRDLWNAYAVVNWEALAKEAQGIQFPMKILIPSEPKIRTQVSMKGVLTPETIANAPIELIGQKVKLEIVEQPACNKIRFRYASNAARDGEMYTN